MSNPNGRKGTGFERDVQEYLRARFGIVERLPRNGTKDEGDLWYTWNGQYHVIEAKNEQRISLSQYMKEKEVEGRNWHAARPGLLVPHTVAIVKRRQHPVGKSYVVQELDDYVRLVKT